MSNNTTMLKYLKITGTPYEAGLALGRFGMEAVRRHLVHTHAWKEVMRRRGSERARLMEALVRERHPRCWQELEGMAHGLDLPVADVFLWNCRGDLWAMAPDGCTTVQIPGEDVRRLVHNEDGDPGFAGACAIAEMDVDGGVPFASFVYPASLPGHTIAVTEAGLAMTVNNLRALNVGAGVPRMVLTRALLDMPDLESAMDLLRNAPRSGGFHLTLAHRDAPELLSVEFTEAACSIREVREPALHSNHMVHPGMRDHPQIITGSSGCRQILGDALIAASGEAGPDALAILRNQDNKVFPIYRDAPDDEDNENTMATADICVSRDGIEWAIYTSRTGQPRFHMTNGHRTHQQE